MFISIALLFATAPQTPGKCSYNREQMLLLDQSAFDQDMTGGWRSLAANGCYIEAADLIREWRDAHDAEDTTLYWHEGQMRANASQYDQAISLFEASRHPGGEDEKWGWKLYVDGSVAFLKGDIGALKLARKRLSTLPEPPELKDLKDVQGNPSKTAWPMNLHVLDAFIRCW